MNSDDSAAKLRVNGAESALARGGLPGMARRIGIDVGALFLKAVRMDRTGEPVASFYRRHHGDPATALKEAIEALGIGESDELAFTGCNGEAFGKILEAPYRDVTLCQIDPIRTAAPDASYIMDIGGASATLIQLDGNGKFQGYSSNSLCAAGTGSFLDEQAARLELSYEETCHFGHHANPPTIATRCTVFAKSDLVHRQQEGWSRVDMWSGLCCGMTRTLFGTLLAGRQLDGKTVLIGGVAQNMEVVRWIDKAYPNLTVVPKSPQLQAALGAAQAARRAGRWLTGLNQLDQTRRKHLPRFDWPLTMERSKYPSFGTEECWVDDDANEVRITKWPAGQEVRVFLGIDIGSTSTKAVFIDDDQNVLADIYRKTSGDPIGATKLLFRAIRGLTVTRKARLAILGVGTTGSGRKIVGEVIGADLIVNEISAHVAGAAKTDPTIDTIFEIGGQDSKYMHLRDGHIQDSSMNYVCAAGTGSFVEEQAKKLGYTVAEAGSAVIGVRPPRATDRCTVFMEQDMTRLIQSGATPQEAFAAVMVSVTKNYLRRVVGNRYRSREKIFFQGATARNPGLVAAFERLLNVEVVVSPFCHVMGAYGAALLTREVMKTQEEKSAFRGLDLENRDISLRRETCVLCPNHCSITFADIQGVTESPSWGYMCGREPGETKRRVSPHTRLLRRRQSLWQAAGCGIELPTDAPTVGIPQALTIYTYLPLWRPFFNRLGYQIRLSGPTTQAVRDLGSRLSGAEFCFPAKTFLGHAASLAAQQGVDYLFLPQMKSEVVSRHVTNAAFCPYAMASYACTKAALKLNGIDAVPILSPLIDLRFSPKRTISQLVKALAGPLDRSAKEIAAAWMEARTVLRTFQAECVQEGEKALADAERNGEKLLALVGRPYNLYDQGLNLGLPERIAEQGRTVIPLDFLPLDLSRLGERYRNSFWEYGQKILAALEEVATNDLLDAVYFTNFSCGPDSFLLTYAQEIMGAKPFLALELDEHGSDTGYLTRIEAYFDVLRRRRREALRRRHFTPHPTDFRDRQLWIPNMHPFTTELMAAAFRHHGLQAKPLVLETEQTYELGRSVTRGSECLPTALTIGSLLTVLRAARDEKHAFFMPTSQGPCRFGQYVSLHRQILDREGFADVPILSPTNMNGYQGLDEPIRRTLWKAMVLGDILMKAGCKIRPYERDPEETNARLERELQRLSQAIERGEGLEAAVAQTVRTLSAIPMVEGKKKPLVGIVGEIYVRNNFYANENVVRSVEQFGAEAWMVPLSEWVLFTSSMSHIREKTGQFICKELLSSFLKWRWMLRWERKLFAAASPLLDDRHEPSLQAVLDEAYPYLPENPGGETILTIGRAIKFAEQGASLVVNVAPFTCMPGAITMAIFQHVSAERRFPVVNMFYDGTGGQNRRLEVYLRTALAAQAEPGSPRLRVGLPAASSTDSSQREKEKGHPDETRVCQHHAGAAPIRFDGQHLPAAGAAGCAQRRHAQSH
jgi:predicted CoA-substrate-specific enzyme activase